MNRGATTVQFPELESVRRLRESREGGPGSGPKKGTVGAGGNSLLFGMKHVAKTQSKQDKQNAQDLWRRHSSEGGPGSGPRKGAQGRSGPEMADHYAKNKPGADEGSKKSNLHKIADAMNEAKQSARRDGNRVTLRDLSRAEAHLRRGDADSAGKTLIGSMRHALARSERANHDIMSAGEYLHSDHLAALSKALS